MQKIISDYSIKILLDRIISLSDPKKLEETFCRESADTCKTFCVLSQKNINLKQSECRDLDYIQKILSFQKKNNKEQFYRTLIFYLRELRK